MASLLIELPDSVMHAEVNGAVTVGRDMTASICIKHPTVSRKHLHIRQGEFGFVLQDAGSANGTSVNGEPVKGMVPLQDGDRVRIGAVRAVFHLGLTSAGPEAPTPEIDPGIVFQCVCGKRLWAPSSRVGLDAICRHCGNRMAVPKPEKGDKSGTVSGMTVVQDETDEEEEAVEEMAGVVTAEALSTRPRQPMQPKLKMCAVCQWSIEPDDEVHACEGCGLEYHKECWEQNLGCSAYGCAEVGALAENPPEQPLEESLVDATIDEPNFPVGHLLLGSAGMLSLLGAMLYGIPALLVSVTATVVLIRDARWRNLVGMASIPIALLGAALGAGFSLYWWLNINVLHWLGL